MFFLDLCNLQHQDCADGQHCKNRHRHTPVKEQHTNKGKQQQKAHADRIRQPVAHGKFHIGKIACKGANQLTGFLGGKEAETLTAQFLNICNTLVCRVVICASIGVVIGDQLHNILQKDIGNPYHRNFNQQRNIQRIWRIKRLPQEIDRHVCKDRGENAECLREKQPQRRSNDLFRMVEGKLPDHLKHRQVLPSSANFRFRSELPKDVHTGHLLSAVRYVSRAP